jgi:hypothetical protein
VRPDFADSNAKDLYDSLEKKGYVCRRIGKTRKNEKGIPDAIVARRGDLYRRNHLLEVKKLGSHLNENQVAFAREWPGCVHVATSSFEADLLIRECEAATAARRTA